MAKWAQKVGCRGSYWFTTRFSTNDHFNRLKDASQFWDEVWFCPTDDPDELSCRSLFNSK
jgi:hypothetical protein